MTTLSGVRVLDLSRVFAGPWAAQMLADFGADVIKVERPGRGDDVRQQGVRAKDADGNETRETSSFLAMNRGKRSITVDMSKPEGQQLIRELARKCDVLVENFKAGDLKRYGLDYASLREENPRLVYCSITGFGQSGPYSHLPGYDPIFQSMSGLMSITGLPDDEPGGGPMRVGFSVADITAGFYATNAILAALRHRDVVSGEGQYIDLALLDAQIAAMAHIAQIYLVTGQQPQRVGTASLITCPWQAFECSDGQIVVAVGNDKQFGAFCKVLGLNDLPGDERFATNPLRAKNQKVLVPMLAEVFRTRTVNQWYEAFDAVNVPSGPINDFDQVFSDPQVQHREMLVKVKHPQIGEVPLVANPIKFSATPIAYDIPPPLVGQHTDDVLQEVLGMDATQVEQLRRNGIL